MCVKFLELCFSMCGPGTSSIGSPWENVRAQSNLLKSESAF